MLLQTNKIFLVIILLVFTSCNKQKENIPRKEAYVYSVRVCNWIGGKTYFCNYYLRDKNIYKLFNKDSVLIVELVIAEGYLISIEKLN